MEILVISAILVTLFALGFIIKSTIERDRKEARKIGGTVLNVPLMYGDKSVTKEEYLEMLMGDKNVSKKTLSVCCDMDAFFSTMIRLFTKYEVLNVSETDKASQQTTLVKFTNVIGRTSYDAYVTVTWQLAPVSNFSTRIPKSSITNGNLVRVIASIWFIYPNEGTFTNSGIKLDSLMRAVEASTIERKQVPMPETKIFNLKKSFGTWELVPFVIPSSWGKHYSVFPLENLFPMVEIKYKEVIRQVSGKKIVDFMLHMLQQGSSFALSGDMGVGKTRLMQYICYQLSTQPGIRLVQCTVNTLELLKSADFNWDCLEGFEGRTIFVIDQAEEAFKSKKINGFLLEVVDGNLSSEYHTSCFSAFNGAMDEFRKELFRNSRMATIFIKPMDPANAWKIVTLIQDSIKDNKELRFDVDKFKACLEKNGSIVASDLFEFLTERKMDALLEAVKDLESDVPKEKETIPAGTTIELPVNAPTLGPQPVKKITNTKVK